tara:strand:+ start:4637 stop:5569 length:933 start_codon:yes stop_codon:yes gene_type:complete
MIDIVLATYNGAQFLNEQICSIQACDGYNKLIKRFIIIDNGSTDGTLKLVESHQQSDRKIELHLNHSGKKGVQENFSAGLMLITSDYVMLSDQDDVWLKDKIVLSFNKLKELEKNTKADQPILVFSDKKIVDEQLNILNDSDYELSKLPKDWHLQTKHLLQRNVASGCTMLFNRHLLSKAMPLPNQAFMHDWWFALIASYYGVIALIDKPLILYRQHNSNIIGSPKRSYWLLLLNAKTSYQLFESNFNKAMIQAKHFEKVTHQKFQFTALSCFSFIKIFHYVLFKNITQSGMIRKLSIIYLLLRRRYKRK